MVRTGEQQELLLDQFDWHQNSDIEAQSKWMKKCKNKKCQEQQQWVNSNNKLAWQCQSLIHSTRNGDLGFPRHC